MRLHRFIGQFDFSQSLTSLADPRTVRRIIKVFRLAEGDSVILSDGNGRECIAEIKKIEGKKIYLLIRKENGSVNRAPGGITLYCAILKREHFKLMVQKTTEIGIAEITPMITDRTVKKTLTLDACAISRVNQPSNPDSNSSRISGSRFHSKKRSKKRETRKLFSFSTRQAVNSKSEPSHIRKILRFLSARKADGAMRSAPLPPRTAGTSCAYSRRHCALIPQPSLQASSHPIPKQARIR